MKYLISLFFLFLSGIAWASESLPNNSATQYSAYPSYGYQNNNYQAYGNPNAYYQQGYYAAPTYQPSAYYAPQYTYPVYQNPYGYGNYYQAPNTYQEQVQSNPVSSNPEKHVPKKLSVKKKKQSVTSQTTRLSNKTIKKLTRSERNKKFLMKILPLVLNENKRIEKHRQQMLPILNKLQSQQSISNEEKQWLKKLSRKYRISGNIIEKVELQQELVKRVHIISPSMALAQAANESAWGTSRFSKQGNNLFGIWTYNEKIGIKPLKRAPGKKHFVRKFSSFQESVTVYIHTLNTHAAYKKLREIRHQAVLSGKKLSGHELALGLEKYSAKGQEYIKMIQQMINSNNLENIAMGQIVVPELASR